MRLLLDTHRLMISQSLAEDIPIVSRDKVFSQYSTQLIW
jgi:PIN domain nuclease of toxin-antitoxin system